MAQGLRPRRGLLISSARATSRRIGPNDCITLGILGIS